MGRDGVRESLVSSWNIPPACLHQTGGSLFQSGKEGFYDNSNYCHSCCDRLVNSHDDHGYYPETEVIALSGSRFPGSSLPHTTIHPALRPFYTPLPRRGIPTTTASLN